MIYCITLIIIVAIICATRLYPLWVEHDRNKADKAMQIVSKVREENNKLRNELDETYKEWLGELSKRDKAWNETWDLMLKLAEKLNMKIK